MATALYEVQISGRDLGGYVWQNVFHVFGGAAGDPLATTLSNLLSEVESTIIPPMADAMCEDTKIYNIAARRIITPPSYTLNKGLDVDGTRAEVASPGAVCGRIAWYPATGTNVGRQFISGTCEGDVVADLLAAPYISLLEGVMNAFLTLDGAVAPEDWQFTIFNKNSLANVAVIAGAVLPRVGVLSKRVRA